MGELQECCSAQDPQRQLTVGYARTNHPLQTTSGSYPLSEPHPSRILTLSFLQNDRNRILIGIMAMPKPSCMLADTINHRPYTKSNILYLTCNC